MGYAIMCRTDESELLDAEEASRIISTIVCRASVRYDTSVISADDLGADDLARKKRSDSEMLKLIDLLVARCGSIAGRIRHRASMVEHAGREIPRIHICRGEPN